jgi:hypothetical protein
VLLLSQWWGYEGLFLVVKTKGLEVVDHSYIYTKPKNPMKLKILMKPDRLRMLILQRRIGPLTVSVLEEKVWDMKSKAEYLKKIVFDYFVLFMIVRIFTLQMTKEGGKTSRKAQHSCRKN